MDKEELKEIARGVIRVEAEAVASLAERIDDAFIKAVNLILGASGKVVVTGMGKSGVICQKIASTLASTGTAAFFLHPAEGAHGDLGMLMKNDILIAVSNSGETEEIVKMIPIVKRMGIKTIVMTGRAKSTLAGYADVILNVCVKEEACPLGLAPTASTTATLAMGDALAVALLSARGFKEEDFATLHPAGSLGRKLLPISELMRSGDDVPRVSPETGMEEAILVMSKGRIGLTGVFEGEALVGVITDGDLRRALKGEAQVFAMKAGEVMTRGAKYILKAELAEAALNLMESHSITALFVKDKADGKTVGVIHLHDLIKAGVI